MQLAVPCKVNTAQDGDQWSAYFVAWLYHWGQDPQEACLSSGCPAALSEYFEFVDRWPVQLDQHKWLQPLAFMSPFACTHEVLCAKTSRCIYSAKVLLVQLLRVTGRFAG